MSQSEDSFIGRWSRRKKQAAAPADAAGESAAHEDSVEQTDSAGPAGVKADEISTPDTDNSGELADRETTDTGPPTDADMVALETLGADSDYSPFMSEGVSSELRKAALKKLFFSGKFAARDGLDDYDDDFTYFEPLGDTVTSDMKYHARRKEKARLAKLEEEKVALEQQALDEEALHEQAESSSAPIDANEVEAESADDSGDPDTRPVPASEQNVPTEKSISDAEIHLASVEDDGQEISGHNSNKVNQSSTNDPDSGKNV